MGSPRLPTSISILIGALLGASAGLVMHYPDWRDGWLSSDLTPYTVPDMHDQVADAPSRVPAEPMIRPLADAGAVLLPDPSDAGLAHADPPAAARVDPEDAGAANDAFAALPSFSALATPDELSHGSEQCGAGDGRACIRLGLSYAEGVGVPTDQMTARRLRQRAIGILVRQCHDVDAAACMAVARLYKDGIGLQPSDASALALIERAQMLCRLNDQPGCPGVSGAGRATE